MKRIITLLIIPLSLMCLCSCSKGNEYLGEDWCESPPLYIRNVTGVTEVESYQIPEDVFPDIEEQKIVFITNEKSLHQAFRITKYDWPAIDFQKEKLLLVRGTTMYQMHALQSSVRFEEDKYHINISIETSLAAALDQWCVAYKIPATLSKEDFELTIK